MSKKRLAVLECIKQHGPITPKDITSRLNEKPNNIKQLLYKLRKDDEVQSNNEGLYTINNPSNPSDR